MENKCIEILKEKEDTIERLNKELEYLHKKQVQIVKDALLRVVNKEVEMKDWLKWYIPNEYERNTDFKNMIDELEEKYGSLLSYY